MVGHHPGQPPCGHDFNGLLWVAHFRLGPADQVLNGADISHHRTRLNLTHGCTSQHRIGHGELHIGQHGRLLEQCLHRDAHPGGDAAAQIASLCAQGVHSGGCAEIQHDQRGSIFLNGGNIGHRPVRSQPLVSRHTVGEARVYVPIDYQGLTAEVFDHSTGEGVHHLGHH